MKGNEKADRCGIGSKAGFTGHESQALSASDYKSFRRNRQCKSCRSELMAFAVDGYCRDCRRVAARILDRWIESYRPMGKGGAYDV